MAKFPRNNRLRKVKHGAKEERDREEFRVRWNEQLRKYRSRRDTTNNPSRKPETRASVSVSCWSGGARWMETPEGRRYAGLFCVSPQSNKKLQGNTRLSSATQFAEETQSRLPSRSGKQNQEGKLGDWRIDFSGHTRGWLIWPDLTAD